jgi:FMN reductase
MPVKVLGVSGSMREGSYSAAALRIALEAAAEHGAQTRLLDLRAAELPMYSPDHPHEIEPLRAATEALTWAEAIILATPDYHGSMSGATKNFLDYHWEELAGKLVGYIAASHEKGITAQQQMRTAVQQCYGWSLPYGVAIHGENDFNPSDRTIKNPTLLARLRMLGRDMIVYGDMLHRQFKRDLAEHTAVTFAARYRK